MWCPEPKGPPVPLSPANTLNTLVQSLAFVTEMNVEKYDFGRKRKNSFAIFAFGYFFGNY